MLLEEDDPSDTDEADDVFGEDDYDDAQETYHITRTSKSKSFWWGPELSSDTAGKALKALFPDRSNPFDYPKAVEFVKRIVHMAAGPDDLILASFAGSGTTAEAVLAVNADDGGRRRFILVESEAYADDLTAERVRRVIQRDAGAASLSPAISGATFSFFALGDEIDIGSLLTGDKLSDFESLARYVFYTATGRTLDGVPKPRADYRIGETATHSVHLLYRLDRDFMRSADSALTSKVVDAQGHSVLITGFQERAADRS